MITVFTWCMGHFDELILIGTTLLIACLVIIAWMSTHVPNDSRGSVTLVLMDGSRSSFDSSHNHQHRRSGSQSETLLTQLPNTRDTEAHLRHSRSGSNVSDAGSLSVLGDDSPETTLVMLRLKYLDDRIETVYTSLQESIRSFKTKIFHNELSENLNVRLIYNGRELKEGKRLSAYGLADGSTIHCLVTSRRIGGSRNAHDINLDGVEGSEEANGLSYVTGDRDISRLVFPVFGVLVGLIWYCRIAYKQYFNVISTFALLGITVLFLAASFTLWSSAYTVPSVASTGNPTAIQDLQTGASAGDNTAVRVVRYQTE